MKNIIYLFTLIGFIFTVLSCKNDPKMIAHNSKKNFLFDSLSNEIINKNEELPQKYKDSVAGIIDKFYKKNWANNSMNGGFLVAKGGEIIFEKYNGYANFYSKTIITANTPLHIASVSKVVTATAILMLIDQKRLELDTKLNTILETFPFPDVTIRTLLNHRSGLKNYTHFTYDKKVWDYSKTLTNADILNILATKKIPLETKTNTHFAYCNTNYALLALVIEKITGMNYPKAIKTMIFEPLQMADSYVFNNENNLETAALSYKANGSKYGFEYLDAVYGDKNVYSTPRDLLKLDIARNAIGFFSQNLDAQIYQGYSYESRGTKNYGLGIRMIEWPTGQRFYFHNGWWHGNTSSYISLPKDGLTIICLSNKFTHATYKVKNVSVLFGDYPFKIEDEE